MKNNSEDHFDDIIRKKLLNAEETVPFNWEQLERKMSNPGRNWLRGFLLSDLLLAILFLGFFYQSTCSNRLEGSLQRLAVENQNNGIAAVASSSSSSTLPNNKSTKLYSRFSDDRNQANSEKKVLNGNATQEFGHRKLSTVVETSNSNEHNVYASFRRHQGKFKNLAINNNGTRTSINEDVRGTKAKRTVSKNIIVQKSELPDPIDQIRNYDFLQEPVSEDVLNTKTISDSLPRIMLNGNSNLLSLDLFGFVPYDVSAASSKEAGASLSYQHTMQLKNTGFGLMLNYAAAKNMVVSIGMQWSANNYKLSYRFPYSSAFWNVDSITGYILSPFDPPVPLTLYDSTLLHISHVASVDVHIKETEFQTPIMISYCLEKNKWTVAASAGVVYAFTNRRSLTYPILYTDAADKIKTLLPVFKYSHQLSGTFGVSIAREVATAISIYIQPYYQQAITSVTVDDSPVGVRHRSAGIKAGLRIKLSGK